MQSKISARLVRLFLSIVGCLMLLHAVAVPAHAANNCPWLNEATASGLLGGQATGNFQDASGMQPAACTFTEEVNGSARTLRIEVETTSDFAAKLKSLETKCGAQMKPLASIGNEAVFCPAGGAEKQIGEMAIGRVRDQVFTIRIGSSLKSDAEMTPGNLEQCIRTAAEEVTGNLF